MNALAVAPFPVLASDPPAADAIVIVLVGNRQLGAVVGSAVCVCAECVAMSKHSNLLRYDGNYKWVYRAQGRKSERANCIRIRTYMVTVTSSMSTSTFMYMSTNPQHCTT